MEQLQQYLEALKSPPDGAFVSFVSFVTWSAGANAR